MVGHPTLSLADAAASPLPNSPAKLTPAYRGLPSAGRARLIAGDNLAALHALSVQHPESVSLAYLDPPFFTNRQHQRVDRKRTDQGIERTLRPAFDDRWETLTEYLQAIRQRLVPLRDLLSPHGCLVVHVDSKTSHYIKVLCDEIFGMEAFSSEVIWRYRRWPAKTTNFQRVHDCMLRYVKDPKVKPRFTQLYEPLAPSTQKTWGDRKQRAVVGEQGRRLRSSKTEEASKGVPLGDVWDIPIVAPVAKERTGYPTQKPLALLRRWIEACTEPGDLVLDPYMGSGTTLVAAAELGRAGLGIDLGQDACELTAARLETASIPFERQHIASTLRKAEPRKAGLAQAV